MDATRMKEARTTKDNMAKDSNGRATRYGALVSKAQVTPTDIVVVALCLSGDEEDK